MRPSGAAQVAGVAGWPISHSLSPRLMAAWIEAAGLDAIYAPFAIGPEGAEEAFKVLAKTGLTGLNITLPHKEIALKIADSSSDAAKAVGAANLLTFKDGKSCADNTDVAGFLSSLEEGGADPAYDPASGPALVLGAGGAARAIVYALKLAGCPEIILSNRTESRATALAEEMAINCSILPWDRRDEGLEQANLVINTTSLGLKGQNDLVMDWDQASQSCVVVDIVYTPLETGFLKAAAGRGLKTIDGLGMLIGQARPSFEAFFGVPSDDQLDVRALLETVLRHKS